VRGACCLALCGVHMRAHACRLALAFQPRPGLCFVAREPGRIAHDSVDRVHAPIGIPKRDDSLLGLAAHLRRYEWQWAVFTGANRGEDRKRKFIGGIGPRYDNMLRIGLVLRDF